MILLRRNVPLLVAASDEEYQLANTNPNELLLQERVARLYREEGFDAALYR
jgi:hypothetical protein